MNLRRAGCVTSHKKCFGQIQDNTISLILLSYNRLRRCTERLRTRKNRQEQPNGSPGWILKILSSYCIILCFFNLIRSVPRFDTPFSSIQRFVEGLKAECSTSVKGV